ncbi:MAG: GHKL domain-containing protein [Bacteroidales bacterium]|nr:GHKL domain-containing protein [Bacteroidales bacterium]
MLLRKKNIVISLLLVVALILSWLSFELKNREYDFFTITEKFQKQFLQREMQAIRTLDEVHLSFEQSGELFFANQQWVESLNQKYYDQGEVVFITRGDSVLFLSHNALPVHHNNLPAETRGINHMTNGWYYAVSRIQNDYRVWVASLVKNDFRYKNRFLVNTFQEDYDMPDFVRISSQPLENFSVFDQDGNFAFSLLVPEDQDKSYIRSGFWLVSVFFSLAVLVLLLILLYNAFLYKLKKREVWQGVLLLFAALTIIRVAMFYVQIPRCFYQGDLFSAGHYATSYMLPSLGDLILNVLFITVFLFILFAHRSRIYLPENSGLVLKTGLSFLLLLFLAFAAYMLIISLQDLVINSRLSLNVNFIFSPDIYNILGFLIISLFFTSYYFLSNTVFHLVNRYISNRNEKLILFAISALVASIVFYFAGNEYFTLWMLLFATSFLYFFKRRSTHVSLSFTRLIISFFLFSMIATLGLQIFNHEKENAKRQNVAIRLSSEQDPVAEFLFTDFEKDLFNDTVLFDFVKRDPYNEEGILEYLKAEYFSGFWAKYDIQLTTCASREVLFFPSFDAELDCFYYFDFLIDEFGKQTLSNHFIYLDNNTGRNSYISIIPVLSESDGSILYRLFIEFEARFIPRELGFPELLVDEQIDISRNIGNYSYAIYKDDIMTLKYGPYFFSINATAYNAGDDTFVYFDADGYNHLMYNRDENTRIMVSKPKESMLERIAPFSYLFIVFFLFSIIIWMSVLQINNEFRFSLNFKKRLQFSIIGIVLVSVVSIGSASAWFIFNIYKNKNEAIINEKAHGVLIEMENLLADEPYLDSSYEEYLNQVLMRLSHVFFTDINLFNPRGDLLASSRPRVFEEGLISPVIDPVAYNHLKISRKSLFIHNERIGNLEYISTYVPLRNLAGDLIAYINLPYFAQQSELRNEISYFLVAFINIYLLLLLLSVIIAFFISNYVTRPLQLIRNSISRVSFGKTNKKIEWDREDEIGQLISEYNRMIDELSVSAELLARSERESAWREMAKQVAHEIKNPLTPMRLNVQYLQRAWKDRTEDWEERLDRFTKTMVEQIDSLAVIAAEFSDFAKMPVTQNEEIDLHKFIPEVVDLYKGFDNVDIDASLPVNHKDLKISADRKQLLRVFNNLIKNAIQAYDKNQRAKIHIHCEKEENYYRLEVQDFGCGIPDDLKKNIFQPYFTTKNAGMGLGLAMVKSIIESFNGHISFDSKENEGTRFVMRIPAFNGAQNAPDAN